MVKCAVFTVYCTLYTTVYNVYYITPFQAGGAQQLIQGTHAGWWDPF